MQMGNAAAVADHREVSAMISLLEKSLKKMECNNLRVPDRASHLQLASERKESSEH
jgi:hypothetical protein